MSRKHKAFPPRRKRLKRVTRLNAAKEWLATFKGKHVVKSYARWFGVDTRCALIELQMLGVQLNPAYVAAVNNALRHRRRTVRSAEPDLEDSDEYFAYIAGYTEGGAPFGITWDELDPDDEIFGERQKGP